MLSYDRLNIEVGIISFSSLTMNPAYKRYISQPLMYGNSQTDSLTLVRVAERPRAKRSLTQDSGVCSVGLAGTVDALGGVARKKRSGIKYPPEDSCNNSPTK